MASTWELQPVDMITAAELARDRIDIAEEDYPAGEYLLPAGNQPSYLGQALAILLYDDAAVYEAAKEQIVYNGKGVRQGAKIPLKQPTYYEPETSIVHFVDEKGDERFAQTIQGPVHPGQPGAKNKQAMEYVDFIGARLNSDFADVYKQTY